MSQFKGKAIYQPSGKAAEYAEWACNFYVGCSNGCDYCYCKKGILAGVMGQDKPQLKKCFRDENAAIEQFRKELGRNLLWEGENSTLKTHGIFFSFTTDPMLEETIGLTIDALIACNDNDVPVKILTKMADWIDPFLEYGYGNIDNIAIGFTLTGHDELEPCASPNTERIKAMRKLHDAGFKTFASIEPIIDFPSAKSCILFTLGFCDLYKIGLMSGKKYDQHRAQLFIEWLNELKEEPKIYLKESLRKLTRYTPRELGENFVERDYKL